MSSSDVPQAYELTDTDHHRIACVRACKPTCRKCGKIASDVRVELFAKDSIACFATICEICGFLPGGKIVDLPGFQEKITSDDLLKTLESVPESGLIAWSYPGDPLSEEGRRFKESLRQSFEALWTGPDRSEIVVLPDIFEIECLPAPDLVSQHTT